jgi:mono/diheme cytochrome c family protein
MEDLVTIRCTTSFLAFLFVVCSASAQNSHPAQPAAAVPQTDKIQLPPTYVPSGMQMFKQYCASCHGLDGKGRGPVAASFRKPPPNLTTLATRHGGSFPEEYVRNLLRFGPGFSAHGSSEMPVWGPIFQYLDNYNEAAVRQRIKNLSEFLESIQEK